LRDDHRCSLHPIAGENACDGDWSVGRNQSQVLAPGLVAQARADAREAKAFHGCRLESYFHRHLQVPIQYGSSARTQTREPDVSNEYFLYAGDGDGLIRDAIICRGSA
jgi:hypothetical protein